MKRVLITGATSGIGRATAELLAGKGFKVVISGRREDRLKELSESFPDQVFPIVCDITDTEAARKHVREACRLLGGLDVVIVNAGVGNRNTHHTWEPDKLVIETNISGFSACAFEALAIFREQGFGHLIGISSVAGRTSFARSAAYNASKAFVSNYLRGLRLRALRWSPSIKITDVRPGFVQSEMTDGLKGMFWVISAETFAEQLFKTIGKPKKIAYIPSKWAFVGAILPFVPDWILKKIH